MIFFWGRSSRDDDFRCFLISTSKSVSESSFLTGLRGTGLSRDFLLSDLIGLSTDLPDSDLPDFDVFDSVLLEELLELATALSGPGRILLFRIQNLYTKLI